MSAPHAQTRLKTRVLGTMAAIVICCLYRTLRWRRINFGPNDAAWTGDGQRIFAFWHGRMLMLPGCYWHANAASVRPIFVLISPHGDGRLIAHAVKYLRINSVAGSSSKRGAAALLALYRLAKQGASLAITPDGPRGPKHVCKEGIVALAQRTNLPIYPLAYSAKYRWRLRSWDGMVIPQPFSPAVALTGDPIIVQEEDDLEAARVRVEEALNELTERADRTWAAI